jgi:hypothetical protein
MRSSRPWCAIRGGLCLGHALSLECSASSRNIQLQRISERTYELRLSAGVSEEPDVEVELTEGPGNAPLL